MQHRPSPLNPPTFRADLPTYPVHDQVVRVTNKTIPGPSGYMSSSVLGASLYIGFTQQLRNDTLIPRDREPCVVLDLNRYGLAPGYYNARLAGSYQSVPVYEVGGSPVNPVLALRPASGLTPAQVESLSTLTTEQLAVLGNLTPCQLQVLLEALPLSQIQTLTLSITSTQLYNFVNLMTADELLALYNQLTTSQIRVLVSNLDFNEVHTLTNALTVQQLWQLIINLTPTELQIVACDSCADLEYLFSEVTVAELNTVLDQLTTAQTKTLFSLPPTQIVTLIDEFTIAQIQTFLTGRPVPPSVPITPYAPTLTGTQTNLVIPLFIEVFAPVLNGNVTITGFDSATLVEGQTLVIVNPETNTNTLTLKHNNNDDIEFFFSTSADVALTPGRSVTVTVSPDGAACTDVAGSLALGGGSGSSTGVLLANFEVLGGESTTSTSYTDLATADSVTFTLSATTTVIIDYLCQITFAASIMGETGFNIINEDGSDVTGTAVSCGGHTVNNTATSHCVYTVSLASGSHTIKVRHKTQNGGSTTWQCRQLKVWSAP